MDNLKIYNDVRKVPDNAQKPIVGGRLKGKTDINPMWRIKALTEQFGVCGMGWYYKIKEKKLEQGASGEVAAFVDIDLLIKVDGEWSAPIPGTGGSMFIANEKNGAYTSDECYKMALTDALSVACKALGVGADIYWDKDVTKYDKAEPQRKVTDELMPTNENLPFETPKKRGLVDDDMAHEIYSIAIMKGFDEKVVNSVIKTSYQTDNIFELTRAQGEELIKRLEAKK